MATRGQTLNDKCIKKLVWLMQKLPQQVDNK